MIKKAYERGSRDNISVAILEYGKVPRNSDAVRHVALPRVGATDQDRTFRGLLRQQRAGIAIGFLSCLFLVLLAVAAWIGWIHPHFSRLPHQRPSVTTRPARTRPAGTEGPRPEKSTPTPELQERLPSDARPGAPTQ